MSTFELTTNTKAKLTDVVVLSQKNREPNDNPGAQLAFSLLLPNHELTMLDGALRSFLYTKSAASSTSPQGMLEGVEPVSNMPNLTTIGKRVGKLHWDIELTGYTLTIDQGMGGASNIEIGDCEVSKFRLLPQEGGTVAIDFQLESPDVAANTFGRLATLKNREVEILLLPPEVVQGDMADSAPRSSTAHQPDDAWPFKDSDGPEVLTPEKALEESLRGDQEATHG